MGGYVVNSRDVTRRKGRKTIPGRPRNGTVCSSSRYRLLPTSRIRRPSETVYVSPQVMDILGYTPRYASTPDLWLRTLHPDDGEAVLAEDLRTNETEEPFVIECRRFAKDGRLVWIEGRGDTSSGTEEGTSPCWLGVQIDITERKRAEARLGAAEQRFHALVDQIPAVTTLTR